MDGYSEIAPVWVASADAPDGGQSFGAFATADAAKKYFAVKYSILKLEWMQNDREYVGAPKVWIAQNGMDTFYIQQFDVITEDEIA